MNLHRTLTNYFNFWLINSFLFDSEGLEVLMKNISKEALEAYHTLLKYSQLKVNQEIFIRNVDLSAYSHMHEIYTQNITGRQLPHLVLLHGFAGSAMSYIRTFHSLSQHFNVHALDHFGNGFSSRSTYEVNRNQ